MQLVRASANLSIIDFKILQLFLKLLMSFFNNNHFYDLIKVHLYNP